MIQGVGMRRASSARTTTATTTRPAKASAPARAYLRADRREQRPGDHRMEIPAAPEHAYVPEHRRHDEDAEDGHQRARDQEEVGRAVHEQEAEMAPAVAERRELRLAGSGP